MTQHVIGIVGWSGAGKTTLLEYLLPRLTTHGLRVNAVKHSHHDLILEAPHKDSARLRTAGAAEVLVASPYRFALIREMRGAPEPSLAEHCARMAPADLTLVEGYKWEAIPKIEVYRRALGQATLYDQDPHIVAVASDAPSPADLPPHLTWLDINQPQQVLDWLLRYVATAR
jgi:molybdopterin-guanine dinucleotide biosynthesis protein B